MTDWYRVLRVSRQASEGEIKSAYRKLAKKYHPDAHPGDQECESRFREITEAYTILADSQKRRKYDEELGNRPQENAKESHTGASGSAARTGKVNFQDISESFEAFFGFNPGTGKVVNEGKLNSDKNTKNPLDTTNIFEAFMGNIKR